MTWLRITALVLSGLHVLLLAGVVALRITHPYALEWMEGAMVDQVHRVLAQPSLYTEPSVEFVATLYTPLYFYTSAAVASLTGLGFFPLRLVSLVGASISIALIGAFVRRETGDLRFSLLAIGLFAACYEISGAWLDIARVDALGLAWMLGAAYVLRGASRPLHYAAAGLLFTGAYLTKQSGLAVAVPLGIWVALFSGGRAAGAFAGSLAIGVVGSSWAMDQWTGGWYSIYTAALPSEHAIFGPMLIAYWWKDLLQPIPAACLVAVSVIALAIPERRQRLADWRDVGFWFFFLGACVAASWAGRLHSGGHSNVLLPAYASISVAWGVGIHQLVARRPGWLSPAWSWGLCVAQLAVLTYDPRPLVPTKEQRSNGDQLVAAIAAQQGPVLATWHGYLPVLAGKQSFAHQSLIDDILRARQSAPRDALQYDIEQALARQRFGAVIVDHPYLLKGFMKESILEHYRAGGPLFPSAIELGPSAGWKYNPHLYLPKP